MNSMKQRKVFLLILDSDWLNQLRKSNKVHGSFDFEVECTAPIPTSTTPMFSTTVTMVQSTSSGNGSGGNGNGAENGNGSDNESNDDESSDDQSETEFEQTTVAPPTTPFVIKHKERQCCGEFPNRAPYHKASFVAKNGIIKVELVFPMVVISMLQLHHLELGPNDH